MTEDTTYNGWKNYPTWAVNLWLSNDEGTYNHVAGTIAECQGETRRIDAADWLRDYVRSNTEPDEATLAADLLGYALDNVDWYELADTWIAEQVA